MKALKTLRKSENLTLQQLAELINISPQVLSRYEREERQADYNTLIKIANFFNVSIDYLLGNEHGFGVKKIDSAKALPTYTAEEQQLIEDYRSLTPPLQKMIKETIKTFKTSKENLRNKGAKS